MIVNFSVQNFGSIKEKQTLSFEADKTDHLANYYIITLPGGLRLLKLALIYGANASGKTTLLNALNFLRGLVVDPAEKKTERLDFYPFLFDSEMPVQTSGCSIEFIANEIRYLYEVEFSRSAIITEQLFNFNPNKAIIFSRNTDLENQYTRITFGSKIKQNRTDKKVLESNTLWNNTVLGGFLKTNIDFKELKDVTDWFQNYLKRVVSTRTKLDVYVTRRINSSIITKKDVIDILRKADFNISDVLIHEEEDIHYGVPVERDFEIPVTMVREINTKKSGTVFNLEFEHTINNKVYTLPFEMESRGTQRYYGFSGLLSLLIKNSLAIPIDELESSLHPDLYQHFLLSFLVNAKSSQLIATTHNREILENRDIFRNDAIWFTDKNEHCATEVYSLTDFDSSVIRNTSNVLNAYKSGRLKGTPNLGDYYIDSGK
ncbi:MAG TPA: ATP-binding protein [Chitinispirillaceae bacterium]|nr:ATP-binding protein [Chitinispirillaceae bacterium]